MQVVLSLQPGGTERLVVELVRRIGTGLRSVLCCLDESGPLASELPEVPVHVLGRRPGFSPSLGRRIARLAREHDVRVLHCHQYSPFVYGRLAQVAHPGLRMVFTEHGRLSDAPPSRRRWWANQVLGRLPGASLCAVSEDVRRHIVAEGLPEGAVRVIPNGIDPGPEPTPDDRQAARRRLGLGSSALLVGTAARLDPVKDLGTLLEAFAGLTARQEAHLVIFGDGPERRPLVDLMNRLSLAQKVLFTGHRHDVRALLPALDVYVNSSVSEGISLTILEAMAACLPVVATRVGGTPEVIGPETGFLVPARNPTAMTEVLGSLASDPDRRRVLGLAGRTKVLAKFTIDRMVDRYRAEYDAALGRR